MKYIQAKIHSHFSFVLLSLLLCNSLQAQFLKDILNTVKNTAQNRANNVAANTTNKAIDKADPTTKSSNNGANASNSSGRSDQDRVLGGFAKAAQDNPNDTSMSDLIAKSLGNIIGGGGVSAADSVAAINTYTTAKGGSGIYYEYSIESHTKERGTVNSTSKMYLNINGEGRSEMNLAAMMGAKNGSVLIVIGRMKRPHYSIILDDKQKEYSLNVIDTALINNVREKYQVTK
ncbi:MAG: hypothetical protein JST13_09440, partial [Bacteroidetes bacterium]|nr:hypothetical protein [Bacteroidota bacterium]